jgi:hypothetical protein
VHRLPFLLFVLSSAASVNGQLSASNPLSAAQGQAAQGQALVVRALANEYAAARDSSHPMRYELVKTSPRLTTAKKICETRDGDVARLVAVNGKPLSAADEQNEEARLSELLTDPGKQKRRKLGEDDDQARVLKVLRALPTAFKYQDEGPGEGPSGKPGDSPSSKVEKFSFKPNPGFSPPDLETQILTQMTGEIWIDPVNLRVVRLEGHLQRDVDFGWGILGRLNQGGWIVIEQADVGPDMGVDQWRTVHFQMKMSGRVVWKTRVFDTTEDETGYEPVPAGLGYQKAIEMLRADK